MAVPVRLQKTLNFSSEIGFQRLCSLRRQLFFQ